MMIVTAGDHRPTGPPNGQRRKTKIDRADRQSAPQRTAEKLLSPAERTRRTRLLVEAQAIHSAFIERLAAFRVLDPACGSGNFLYVALRALKDIEHRANLDAEALGLPARLPARRPRMCPRHRTQPLCRRTGAGVGMDRRNSVDAEQWLSMRRRNPILRPLNTIECRDAVLNEDGSRAEWPVADVVVGNPPFLGNKSDDRRTWGSLYTLLLEARLAGTVPARRRSRLLLVRQRLGR